MTAASGKIIWDTDCNAACIGRIVEKDTSKDVLIQTDFDCPGVASTFGWDIRTVQPKREGDEDERITPCAHSGTDGTVSCSECGVTASEFIESAGEYLNDNDGAEADDPGYFGND